MAKKETHMSENAKLYELGFHILPTVAENKVADVFKDITGIISKNNGSVIKSGEPQAIKLAYTITKKVATKNERFDSAYFAWIKFNATSDDIEEIKSEVENDQNILRYIVVKTVDDDEHSTIKLVEDEEEDLEEGLEEAKESEMDSEEVIDTSENAETEKEEAEAKEEPKEEEKEPEEESKEKQETEPEEKDTENPDEKEKNDKIDEAIDELVDEK